MNGSSNARILRIAIAASLAIHVIIASVVHSNRVEAQPEQKTGRIIVVKLPKPTLTPAPPRAHPHKVQTHTRAVRHAIKPPQQRSPNNANTHTVQSPPSAEPTGIPNSGDVIASPGPVATEVPATPSPTPKPACSVPDVPAKAIDTVSPQAPPDAPDVPATAKVKVDLDASGNVVGTSIYESTGYQQLDHAAVDAARSSRYAPEEKNCKNVGGSYLFDVNFSQ
jgi:protein TonB